MVGSQTKNEDQRDFISWVTRVLPSFREITCLSFELSLAHCDRFKKLH